MATQLKYRTVYLEQILNLLNALNVEIEYSLSDLPGTVAAVSESDMCSNLQFLKHCAKAEKDFPVAWCESVNNHTPLLTKNERDKLLSFGSSLGTTDLEGQKKLVGLFIKYFSSYYGQAVKKEEKYYTVYIMMGAVAGFGLFILII